jgi:hypothetical protein
VRGQGLLALGDGSNTAKTEIFGRCGPPEPVAPAPWSAPANTGITPRLERGRDQLDPASGHGPADPGEQVGLATA